MSGFTGLKPLLNRKTNTMLPKEEIKFGKTQLKEATVFTAEITLIVGAQVKKTDLPHLDSYATDLLEQELMFDLEQEFMRLNNKLTTETTWQTGPETKVKLVSSPKITKGAAILLIHPADYANLIMTNNNAIYPLPKN